MAGLKEGEVHLNRRDVLALAAAAAAASVATGARPAIAGEPMREAKPGFVFGAIGPDIFAKAQARAAALVARMTPAEMASQLGNTAPAIKRLALPAYQYWHEALHGLLRNGPVTCFPIPLALANTWDPDLQFRIYSAVSDEARAYHNAHGTDLTFYSPQTLNTARDPRWGRIDETLGEDPWLIGTMAGATVRGMQGQNRTYLKTACCAKHFICNETDDDRHTVSEAVNPRSFWEYFLAPFEAAVKAGVATVMAAYNEVNGIPCPADRTLLTDILRKRWGFSGYVTSDCDAVADIYQTHHYVPTAPEAAALALQAGCDLNCGDTYQKYLARAMELQLVTKEQVARAVTRLLTIRMLLGEFDPADRVAFGDIRFSVVDSAAHRELALEAARASMVLLKNDDHFLPLEKSAVRSVAVIGPLAARCPLGGYAGGPFVHVSPLEGIARALGVKLHQNRIPALDFTSIDWEYKFVQNILPDSTLGLARNGYWVELPAADFSGVTSIKARASALHGGGTLEVHADGPTGELVCAIPIAATGAWNKWSEFSAPAKPTSGYHAIYLVFRGAASSTDLFHLDWIELNPVKPVAPSSIKVTSVLGCTVSGPRNPRWLEQASAAAKAADIALVVVGDDQTVDHEQLDRKDIKLPGAQHELIDVVARANPKTIVILASNCPVAIPAEQANPHVPAILCALAAGQAGGQAIADVIFGDYNPGGKLAETWFTGLSQLQRFHDFNILNNRTYMYFTGKPLYPFGHGLSYTTFEFSDLKTSSQNLEPGGSVRIQLTVHNAGRVTGDEVVQLYVRAPKSAVKRPIKQLVDFCRVKNIKPAETRTVHLQLDHDHPSLRYWDDKRQSFIVQPGELEILAGNSSDNILLRDKLHLLI